MTLKTAMKTLIDKGYSKYKIAKVMDIGANMIDNYLNETTRTVRKEAADKLNEYFDIEIYDHCINGYQKEMFINRFNELDHN